MAKVNYLRARNESLASGGHPPVAAATIPVRSGLVYAGLYSGGSDFAVTNWAGPNGIATGAPEEPGRFLSFPAGAYVDTGLPETLGVTCFVIGKAPAAGFGPLVFIGSGVPSGSPGISLFAYSASSIAATLETTGASAGMTLAADINAWGMHALTASEDGSAKKMFNLTAGTSTTSANTTERAITGSQTMRVGASYNGGASGAVDLLCALIFDRALTEGELAELAVWGRAYAADFGFTV